MSKDYYKILGVEKNASHDEVKKAFRILAHKYHPDKKGGDAAKFKEASEAYAVLSDEKRRKEYDTYGQAFGGNGPQGGFGGFNWQDFGGFDFSGFANNGGFQEFDLGDIFGEFFGGGRRERVKRGRDISIDLELSFAESIFGGERKILITKTSKCSHCHGTGGEPGTELRSCPTCNGKGKIHETKRSFLGSFSTVRSCDDCHGSGKIPRDKCRECRGAGTNRKQEEISVKIPTGIDDGEMIRLSGAGEAITGGIPGDLYIKIHVKKHPYFRKDGSNLVTELDIKLSSAILGDEYPLETLDGELKIKIPAGISFGEILRLKGKGVPIDSHRRGDLLIKINIQLPSKLSKEARSHFEELRRGGI